MAILKYRNGDGNFVSLTNYTVTPITPVNTTGTSMSDIMSQKAVTDEVEKKVNKTDIDGYVTSAITGNSGVKQAINGQVATAINDSEAVQNAISGQVANAIDSNETIQGKIDAQVADAITNNESVSDAVTSAVASAISDALGSDGEINKAITAATASKADAATTYNKTEVDGAITAATSGKADAATVNTALEAKVGYADYVSVDKKIYFYKDNTKGTALCEIDASDFIKDGMVDNVEIKDENLVITFNTDTDKSAINIPISSIFDANNYYTKDVADTTFVKSNEINNIVSNAITSNETVNTAVNNAVASAITSNTTVQNAITEATTGKADTTAVAQSITNALSSYSSATEVNAALDAKASADDLTTHTSNTTVHITDNERTAWNAKYDKPQDGIPSTDLAESVQASLDLANSALQSFTETDPTVPAWAKADNKPTYTAEEVGALPSSTAIPSKTSELTNDSEFVISSNIATINGQSLVNGGNIEIAAAGIVDAAITQDSANAVAGGAVYTALQGKANTSTTLSGYGILDAKIEGGVITLGSETITPITSLDGYVTETQVNQIVYGQDSTPSDVSAITTSNIETVLSTSDTISTITTNVNSAKAVTDFNSGHNSVDSIASIPTTKRLVIATLSESSNDFSLSGNKLADGYEIHVIIKNNGTDEITITLPTDGGYELVGSTIKIASGSYGEVNVISDGTTLYVRGV